MRRIAVPTIILAALSAASLHSWAVVALTTSHPGLIGVNLDALGTDWMVFYGADQWVFAGKLAKIFDGDALTAYLNSTFVDWLSQPMPFRPWVYPPSYLLFVLPFGALSFLGSYAAFQLLSAALLALALWVGADRPKARWLVLGTALLGPAAAMNVAQGQNAFLAAALLVGGLRLVRSRANGVGVLLGGAVLGLMTVKPQFWFLVPIALIAAREWRALAASLVAAALLALFSAAVFGLDPWWQWLDLARGAYGDPAGKWMAYGRLAGDSVFACLVHLGAGLALANAAQAIALLLAAGFTFGAFRSRLSGDLKIAVLLASTVLAAPHSSLHDTVLLAVAAGLWIAEVATDDVPLGVWAPALGMWLVPLFNPPETRPIGRLTPLLIIGFIAFALARNRRPIDSVGRFAATSGG
jgi:hypothetical protein